MNRIGVALAADSAVTIGHEANKIYTSADKLYQLSNEAPIGVMVYGNANFVGMPWETIIKSYRRRLGATRFDKAEEYATHLLAYITDNADLFPTPLQRRQITMLIGYLFVSIRETFRERLDQEVIKKQGQGLTAADIPPLAKEVIDQRLAIIRDSPLIDGFPPEHASKVRQEFSAVINDLQSQVFGTLPLPDETVQALAECAVEMLLREYFYPLKCGIVIAGFGEKEYTPSLIAYELEELALGLPRKRVYQRHVIDENSDACILPFAQKDPVDHFLQGIDEDFAKFMQETASTVVAGAIDLVLNKMAVVNQAVSDQIRAAAQPEIGDLLQKLFQEWSNRKERYWGPVLSVVAALPKDELAAMGGALVNLTKFRRRVTPQRETVGGPIDVAVITKGDGFVWLSRKHYFDPALNPRVMARYR